MKITNKRPFLNKSIIALSVVTALSFSACSLENKDTKASAPVAKEKPAIPVQAFTIEQKKALTNKQYPTIIKAYEEVDVVARVQGILEKKFFNEGDFVKKGTVLYQIEDDSYKAALDQAKANFSKTYKDYKRADSLLKSKSISKQSYDQYLFAYEDAKAKLDQAKIAFNYTKVLAPIDGIIGIRHHDVGNFVGTSDNNSLLVSITNVSSVHAEFSLSKRDVSTYLKQIKDKTVDITLEANGKKLFGEVDYISPKIDSQTDSLLLRAKFDNKENDLIAGEFLKLSISNLDLGNVHVVPENAIVKTNKGVFVYVIDENSIAKVRPVETGILVNEGIVIKKGLAVNDKVIVSNIAKIRPESKVNILNKEK